MNDLLLLKAIASVLLFCPFIVAIVLFVVFYKMRMKKRYALGFAADLTTLVLLFSVPLVFRSVFGQGYSSVVLMVLLLIGLVVTFLDWRTLKEIDVPILLKKIWRIYFMVLSFLYMIGCSIGVVMSVMAYLKDV